MAYDFEAERRKQLEQAVPIPPDETLGNLWTSIVGPPRTEEALTQDIQQNPWAYPGGAPPVSKMLPQSVPPQKGAPGGMPSMGFQFMPTDATVNLAGPGGVTGKFQIKAPEPEEVAAQAQGVQQAQGAGVPQKGIQSTGPQKPLQPGQAPQTGPPPAPPVTQAQGPYQPPVPQISPSAQRVITGEEGFEPAPPGAPSPTIGKYVPTDYSRRVTPDFKPLNPIEASKKFITEYNPSYEQTLKEVQSKDTRSRFSRIMTSILLMDPFYSDKINAQKAAMELAAQHNKAMLAADQINSQYAIEEANRLGKLRFAQEQLKLNPDLRNNRNFLMDMGRLQGMSEEEADRWVESKWDKNTGMYNFIKDPVQSAKDDMDNLSTLYQKHMGIPKSIADRLAMDPNKAKGYANDLQAQLEQKKIDAYAQNDMAEVAKINNEQLMINDWKNNNGITAMHQKIAVVQSEMAAIDRMLATGKLSPQAHKDMKENLTKQIMAIKDQHLSSGLMIQNEWKEEQRLDYQRQRREEREAAMQMKMSETQAKQHDQFYKDITDRVKSPSILHEIVMKTDKSMKGAKQEDFSGPIKVYETAKNKYINEHQMTDKAMNPKDPHTPVLNIYKQEMKSMISPRVEADLGRTFTIGDAIALEGLLQHARDNKIVFTYAQLLQGIKEAAARVEAQKEALRQSQPQKK